MATRSSDNPISVEAPVGQEGLSATLRHPARLAALHSLALLDTPAEQAFDRLTRLAAKILRAPVALLSLVDGDRSFFKSSVGLPELWTARREMPLSHSVCRHVVALNAPLVINDARAHPLVSDNRAVAELRIVAYAGIPLVTSAGHTLGTFAVIDIVAREWTPDDVTMLGDLAASALTEIELRAETSQRLLVEGRLRLLESAVVNANDAVIIAEADPTSAADPRIVYVNEAFSLMTGYRPDEIVGKSHQVLQGPETDRSQFDSVRTALATWKPCRVVVLHHRKEGPAFWAELNIVPIANSEGQYSHWVMVQRDVSGQKKLQEHLRESQERTQAILEFALDCIITIDDQGRILEFNPAAERTFGYTRESVLGESMADLIVPSAFRERHARGMDHYRNTGEGPILNRWIEVTALRADGTELPVELAVRATGDKRNPVFTAFLRDISERKEADEALRRAKEAAEVANRAKSDFFSRMSHELRTPLNIILGFGQLLEMDTLSAPQRESVEQICKGGRHLLALINEVLDIARIEAGAAGTVSPEEVDVGEVVREVLRMIQPLANKAGLRLLPPRPGTCGRAVRADHQQLRQILLNLLSNAIKYNRAGGTVLVSWAEAAGAMLRISVTDTGPGIVPEKMHRLFAPFDRLETEQKGVEGTGLGLALSKGLAEAMQGTMGAESTPGTGSTFWIELPRLDKTGEPAQETPAAVADPEETSGTTGTVLYVEDNPANLVLVERILKLRPGVLLLSAMRGQLGLDLAREHRPDVIFLDLHLPDLPGDEVLRRLRDDAATRAIPVIVLSADATPHEIERLLAAGARHYLVKPVVVQDFLHLLDETLSQGRG
jgi:PAS domain S-box-containing protein